MTGAQKDKLDKLKKKHWHMTVDGETPDREVMVSWPDPSEYAEPGARVHGVVTVTGTYEAEPS